MSEQPFTIEALRDVLAYEPDTGYFRWLKPASPRLKVGDRAGSVGGNGRRQITVFGVKCLAHHLAWFHHHGVWPTGYVRQTNGDYDDCRIDNLYEQSAQDAGMTRGMSSLNTSGYRGVSLDKRSGKWQATIRRKWQQAHLGYFATAEEAYAAFLEADKAFRPDVSAEDVEAKTREMGIRRRRRALWALTTRQASGVTGWHDEETFAEDVGDPPGSHYSLISVDITRPIGPGNWQWVLPRHAQFDMTSAEGRSAYQRHRREVNPLAAKASDIRKMFGIEFAEYRAMHDEQEGRCAICGQPETATRKGKLKFLAVDHCHVSNRIRQLLCAACNMAIGLMQDDPARLRSAADYLARHAHKDEAI